MTTYFIDTAVVMFAAGADHPLRRPCAQVLRMHAAGEIDAVTSAEVVQEVLHRFSAGDRSLGDRMAAATLRAFRPVLAVDHDVVERARALMARHPRLHARDAVHVATCVQHGIGLLISPDADFDGLDDISRIDPTTL